MIQEKWKDIIDQIKTYFTVVEHKTEPGELDNESIESIIFERPDGVMKLERHIKPRFLGEKSLYSHRMNTAANVERIYSDTETVDTVKLYKKDGEEWVEVDASMFNK